MSVVVPSDLENVFFFRYSVASGGKRKLIISSAKKSQRSHVLLALVTKFYYGHGTSVINYYDDLGLWCMVKTPVKQLQLNEFQISFVLYH